MKWRQGGVGLIGLFLSLVALGFVAVLVLKIVPVIHEYYTIKKDARTVAAISVDKTIPEIQSTFDKYADVDNISSIQGKDLDIVKGNGIVRISFAYEKKVVLLSNVALLISFKNSTAGR